MSNFPPIDKPFIDRVFKALSVMEIQLDQDPLQYGPKHLSGKIAITRGMLTQCERIYLQVAHMLQEYRAANRASQLEFDLGLQHLLANDPEVRAGRNVKDRDAIATMKLCEEHKVLSDLGTGVLDLEAVMAVIKAKRTDLKDVQSRLRDQMKLCSEEIGLGARWGSRPAPGQASPDLDSAPRVDVTTVDDLRDLFQGSSAELQAPKPTPEKEDEAINNLQDILNEALGDPPTEQDLMEASTPEEFTALSMKQLEALTKAEELTEEEKKEKDVEHWANTLNEQGPVNGKKVIPIEEALPSTDAEPKEVDDFLQAIDPAMPKPKLPNEISIDDILGDL
jgi:hypothetical protein|tara:strand:+ start:26 stop:1033 length:1008 start_codon:yes stop_codon:yes gene_type:complete